MKLCVIIVLMLALPSCSRSEDMTAGERSLLLNVADFRVFGFPEPPNPGEFRKSVGRDGTRELSYVFDTRGLYIVSKILVASSASSAAALETTQRTGLMLVEKTTGIDEQVVPLREKLGESSNLALLTINGRPIGNVFTVVSGRKVLVVTFRGVHFKDAAPFQRFIAGKLNAFFNYEPPPP